MTSSRRAKPPWMWSSMTKIFSSRKIRKRAIEPGGSGHRRIGTSLPSPPGAAPIFGPIPDRLYREFENESDKASNVMLRLELTEAEFESSHKVFETWAEYARTAKLPHNDPYLNGMEFLKSVGENLNQCDEKLKLDTTSGATTTQNSHQQALEYVRGMRKKNKNLHVTDGMFPSDWRPMLLPN